MKVLVTGANGYIGSHVVTTLLNKGVEVTAVDIRSDAIDSRAQFITFNVLDCKNSEDLYTNFGNPDICLHLAWRDGFVHNSLNHLGDLSGHYRFLTNLINHGLKHLAIMGTMHEVGYYDGKIDEDTPCNPLSQYGVAKNALRQSMLLYTKNTDCVLQWIRGFYIYGDDLKNHSIFTKLMEANQRGEKTFPFTTGKNKYDFMQVEMLVEQIVAVILQDRVAGVINCCTGKPVSLSDEVESFISRNRLNIKLDYGVFPDRPYDSPCIYGDNRKIQDIIQSKGNI